MENDMLVTMTKGDLKELIEKTVRGVQADAYQEKNQDLNPSTTLLTRTQAAKFLNVSLVTLDKWTSEGIIPGHRIGFRKLYKESEVLESLEAIQARKFPK